MITQKKRPTTRQAPRYRVQYEDKGLFQLALRRVGGNIDLINIDAYQQDREATIVAAARSIQRSLERRGHLVQAIYERVNIREAQDWHDKEYQALHHQCVEWEWDEEREI
jgi:hypothetical protein